MDRDILEVLHVIAIPALQPLFQNDGLCGRRGSQRRTGLCQRVPTRRKKLLDTNAHARNGENIPRNLGQYRELRGMSLQ